MNKEKLADDIINGFIVYAIGSVIVTLFMIITIYLTTNKQLTDNARKAEIKMIVNEMVMKESLK